jgi:putative N6-adenine-specific DNA methylase
VILVTCPKELPPLLAQEITALGFTVTTVHAAGVEVDAPYEACYDLNLWLRTAHRVLWRVADFDARTPAEMYDGVFDVPWEDWIAADGYVSVISSIHTDVIDNTQFANQKCKDALVDRIREKRGQRPDAGPRNDRAVVFLYWHAATCMVYVDTSGAPLSDRGYRKHPGMAPLRETLAAAIVQSTVWQRAGHLVNPMCGSGTLGIEAALMARNIAPGTIRQNFGLLHLLPTDHERWNRLRAEVRRKALPNVPEGMQILCTDHDRRAVDHARENARAAGVARDIKFDVCDFRETRIPRLPKEPSGHDIILLNPEYGFRLGNEEELEETYAAIGDLLKQGATGYTGYVFTGNLALAKKIGLAAKRKVPFWTADIECRLFEYELYEGTRRSD